MQRKKVTASANKLSLTHAMFFFRRLVPSYNMLCVLHEETNWSPVA